MLVLVREKRTEKAIVGRLFIGSVCIAYTLENAAKAIPCGVYKLENSMSPKFKRTLPLIKGRLSDSAMAEQMVTAIAQNTKVLLVAEV